MTAALLLACTVQSICDTADPGSCDLEDETVTFSGTAALSSFSWDCSDDGWWYDAYTKGIVETVELSMAEAKSAKAPLDETHTVPWSALDPYGHWGDYYLELSIVSRTTDYAPGTTTRFACDDEPGLTWMVQLMGESGTDLGCSAFGAEPERFPQCAQP